MAVGEAGCALVPWRETASGSNSLIDLVVLWPRRLRSKQAEVVDPNKRPSHHQQGVADKRPTV